MYVQVTRAQYHVDKIDEAEAVIRDSILPAAKEQPGFRGAYWAIDRETGKGVGFSFWETRAHAEALIDNGFYREQIAKAASFLDGDPERELYEVAVQV